MFWNKRLANYTIKLTITMVIMVILFHTVGWKELGITLLRTSWLWLLTMYLIELCNRLISAFQMHTLLGWVGSQVNTGRVFLANSLSSLYALFVPGDMIAAGAKWANLSAATGRKSIVLNAIIYNRLALLFPPLIIGGIALAIEDPFKNLSLRLLILFFLLLAIIIAIFLYHPRLGKTTDRIAQSTKRFLPHIVASRIEMMAISLHSFRAMPLISHLSIILLSILSALLGIVAFVMATLAVGIKIPIMTLIWIIALLLTLRLVPITISNLGVREGVLMLILGMYGISPEKAVVLGLVLFSRSVLIALIGLVYQIALNMGWARWDTNSSQDPF